MPDERSIDDLLSLYFRVKEDLCSNMGLTGEELDNKLVDARNVPWYVGTSHPDIIVLDEREDETRVIDFPYWTERTLQYPIRMRLCERYTVASVSGFKHRTGNVFLLLRNTKQVV